MARNTRITRRSVLKGVGTASVVSLSGCLGMGGNGSSEKAEVLHGWTGGDGQDAVNNLIDGFKKQYPDVDANFNAIGGGGNTNLDTTISKRAQNRNLPSSWADWPGANLVQFSESDLLGDIGDVWKKNGMESAYSKEAKRLSRLKGSTVGEGSYAAVPIGSHRLNDLFYNVKVLEKAGVDPTSLSKPADLLNAMKQVENKTDAVGMAQGQKAPWTTLQLWAVVLLGQSGYDAYMNFIDGKGKAKDVRSAFETVKQYSNHFNKNASTADFTTANQKIMNGEAAFIHQGNWVAGAYRNQENFEYDKDWGAVSFPGTEGIYTLHFDSFPFPADGPAPDAAKKFLEYVGTKDAQVRFNKFKGSIPPRTDVPTKEFGPYLTKTIEDYTNAKQKPPTIAHGLAVTSNVLSDLETVINDEFLGSGNIKTATQGMLDAVSKQG
ncbi:ABC transporter substrate-binding protein [Halocatena marina]|uniref:ABC transporter substrate-binding protein n=1 Tax=Halocatena marina TaxID=2934937 RepID=UPI00200CE767|nr:ABC transporter substrate-binding protein [Halocatena marina]